MAIKYHETKYGEIILGNSIDVLKKQEGSSVDLVMTSPPFGLVRKKTVNPKKLKGIQEKIMTHYGFQGSEE